MKLLFIAFFFNLKYLGIILLPKIKKNVNSVISCGVERQTGFRGLVLFSRVGAEHCGSCVGYEQVLGGQWEACGLKGLGACVFLFLILNSSPQPTCHSSHLK